jgi:predicted enzyme related to lactoylglutathione lyase
MPRVVHFEIHADDPERAAKFYNQVFDWKVEKWKGTEDYWLVTTGLDNEPGINGGLMKREEPASRNSIIAYVCTVGVDSVDKFAEKITANGGSIVAPKMAIPGVGWLAYCKDTEGNMFGIMQSDEAAR